MSQGKRGIMRSDSSAERAFKRRFRLLVLLHSKPRQGQELLAALEREQLFTSDRVTDALSAGRQRLYKFRRDIQALRHIGCELPFDRKTGCYAWRNAPFGLSLSESQLAAFALLVHTFASSTILHAADIQALLTFLRERLPADQQKFLADRSSPFDIVLHETTDYRSADQQTVSRIERAINNHQRLTFRYRSPKHGKELDHVIEPEPLVFERGHIYLYGWSLSRQQRLQFRLDYIVPGSAEVLPTTIARSRPTPVSYTLKYWLSSVIARNSVSQHFPGQSVELHPDGSATVTARISITDLFEARRILLSYGENCTVLEPAPLVEQMRIVAVEFSKKYPTREE